MIYIWKILEGLVPNIGVESYIIPQTGCHCTIPSFPAIPSTVRTVYCNSLIFKGSQLFNALPKHLRYLHEVDVFKKQLLLSKVSDEPISWQETQEGNSIKKADHIRLAIENVIKCLRVGGNVCVHAYECMYV